MPTFLQRLANEIGEFKNRMMRPVGTANLGDTDNSEDAKLPISPVWFQNSPYGQPRGTNILEVRQFAASCWLQMIERYITKRFYTTPFTFVNVDEEDDNEYIELRKKALEFFSRKNENGEIFVESLVPTIIDMVETDAGVIVKRYSNDSYAPTTVQFINETGRLTGETTTMMLLKPIGQRTLNELWYADGTTFLKQLTVHRRLMGYFQYSWKYPMANPHFFEKHEISYWSMHPTSYRGYGFSPLQTVLQVVEVLIQSTRWNKDFFKNNAMPNGIVGIEGISEDDVKKISRAWERDFKGKPHKLLLQNGKVSYQPLVMSARDMEWLDGQEWYMHLIFGVYGISPDEVGYTQNVNGKNVQDGQQKSSAKNGIEPYFKYAELRILNDILPDVLGMENPPIKLVWDHQDVEKQGREHTQGMEKLDRHVYTINEIRQREGLDPVEWGDSPVEQQSQDKQLEADAKNNKPKTDPKKSVSKTVAEEAGVEESSEDYGTFFQQQIDKWEDAAVKAVEHVEIEKTFGEFLQAMTNAVNSSAFMTRVKHFIKQSMTEGLDQAEAELEVQVGTGKLFNDRVKALANQQLNGYTINGKHWHGIRGATAEIRLEVLRTVEEGIRNKNTKAEIVKEVRRIFKEGTLAQANRIVRTETTRFINEGKLATYKESGIEGMKAWSVVPVQCCDECHEMSKQVVGFDDDFVTKDNRRIQHPPLHPNCRCVIEYRENS